MIGISCLINTIVEDRRIDITFQKIKRETVRERDIYREKGVSRGRERIDKRQRREDRDVLNYYRL